MTKEQFLELIKTELKETGTIELDTNFKQLENYGSLSAVLILQLVEDNFDVKINPRSFRSINTINDLVNAIGENQFK